MKKIFFIQIFFKFIIIRNKFIRTSSLKNSRILFIPSLSTYYIYIKLKEIKPRISFSKNERSRF